MPPAPDSAALDAETRRLTGIFERAGATLIAPQVLQPAETLLDLYGEDIRARAFVTRDDGGELMLRPDFTVPVVQHHMAFGAEPARYAYAGPVWRRQSLGDTRPREYVQVGFELFARSDPAQADAEVFALIHDALKGDGLSPAIGDLGLVLAAIDALDTPDQRKQALRRHLWRPARFHRLLDRFSGKGPGKDALVAAARQGDIGAMIAEAGPEQGQRSAQDVAARIERLIVEDATPDLVAEEVALIDAVLGLKGPLPDVAARLHSLAQGKPGLAAAANRFAARMQAMEARGIDVGALPFEGSYGRTTLEYYDGFVFGFYAEGRDLPTIASGGRYDALTRVLGGGGGIPAVGAIIRPALVLEART